MRRSSWSWAYPLYLFAALLLSEAAYVFLTPDYGHSMRGLIILVGSALLAIWLGYDIQKETKKEER